MQLAFDCIIVESISVQRYLIRLINISACLRCKFLS